MKPLEGMKIVEIANFIAAPASSRLLADWGANVIKIEALNGDPNRFMGTLNRMPGVDGANPTFDSTAMNKKLVALDLKKEEAKKILFRFLEDADVVLTNFRTDALAKMGLTYEILSEKYPKLIFAQVLGYGETGPEKDTPGYDYTAYGARGGFIGSLHQSDGEPVNAITGYGDFQTSVVLAAGILGAYIGRQKTGVGEKVTVSLHHSAVYMLNWAIMAAAYGNHYPKNRKAVNCPTINTYRGSDGRWMQLCIPEYDRYYNKFVEVIGLKDLVDDERFNKIATLSKTGSNVELIRIIEEKMKEKTVDEWVGLLKENQLPCEKAFEFEEILADEQAWANNILQMITYPTGDEVAVIRTPVMMKNMGLPESNTTGRIGRDTERVLAEHGYTQAQIAQFLTDKIVK